MRTIQRIEAGKEPKGHTAKVLAEVLSGEVNAAYRAGLNFPIAIGQENRTVLNEVWYNSNKNVKRSFKNAQVAGLTSNKPFLDRILLIDMENNTIGLTITSSR